MLCAGPHNVGRHITLSERERRLYFETAAFPLRTPSLRQDSLSLTAPTRNGTNFLSRGRWPRSVAIEEIDWV
jgi:hypothetical protein